MTTIPTLTAAPTAPASSQDSDTFNSNADAFVAWQANVPTEQNAFAAALVELATLAYTATSTTTVSIGTGSKGFAIGTDALFVPGQPVSIASDAAPSTNYMRGTVASYSGGTLTVTVTETGGSGSYNDWSIGLLPSLASLAAGLTMTGLLTTATPASGQEALVIPQGAAPSSPTNGSIWTTSTGVFVRIAGATYQLGSRS